MSHRSSYNPSMDRHWDPMQEAYQNPNFNSYRDGPGANLDLDKQPGSVGNSKEKTMFKLYVGNVPPSIDKEGIENIFRTVAEPVEVIRARPPAAWAFVTFRTLKEAEEARNKLNHRPPMHLKIEYARPQDDGKRRQMEHFEYTKDTESHSVSRKPVENTNLSEMDKICQPRKLGEVIDNIDAAKNCIENYFQKKNGTFEYSKKEYPPNWAQGTCTYCKEPSSQFCAQCKDWYCSKTCQEKDWPRHRTYCRMTSVDNGRSEVSTQGNATQISSPPRKEKVTGGRDLNDHRQNKDFSPQKDDDNFPASNEALPAESRYSKGKDNHHTKKYYNGADSDKSTEALKSPQLPGSEKERSFRNSKLSQETNVTKKGYQNSSRNGSDESESFERDIHNLSSIKFPNDTKETKFSRRGFQNKSCNGSDYSEHRFEKESKSFPRGEYNGNKNPGKFQSKKSLPYDNSQIDRNIESKPKCSSSPKGNQEKPKYSSPTKGNQEKISQSTNVIKEQPKGKPVMVYEQNEELSAQTFTKVSVQIALGSGEYWVVLASNLKDIISMSGAMEMQSNEDPAQLFVGAYCMAKYDNIWFRAKITALKPKLKVFFIDFGNEEETSFEELRMLPDIVKDMKSQAIRIKLAPETSQKYQMVEANEELSVKHIHRNEDGIVTVHVEGEVYRQMPLDNGAIDEIQVNQETSPIALQSVTVLLSSNKLCSLAVTEFNHVEEFLALLVPLDLKNIYNTLFSPEFSEECERIQSVNFVPKIGEAVVAKYKEEGWLRAYVLHVSSKKEVTVASCDLGLVEIVKDVRRMPQRFREIAQFAVQCRVIENKTIDISEFQGKICIESCTSDKAVAVIEKGEKCKIEIKKWEPPYELYEELRCVELNDGDCVISAEMSPFELYIRPLTNPCIEAYNRLLQDVAKHCFNSQPLNYAPKVGQVLASKFTEDNNFYRAVVREVHKSKGVKVQYIDFGNVEYVPNHTLKPLTKELRSVECCVVKVILEDVADRPLNEAVQKLFKELILGNVRLKVKLSEPQSNKVFLYTKDGTNLNEKINKILIPGWKKGFVDKSIYTVNDVGIEILDFDTPLELVILSVIGKNNEIVVRPKRSKTIQVLQNDLQDSIDEYCEKAQEPYTPREMELCLARVENTWCRSLCLAGGNPLSLYLLDMGVVKEVPHELIRKYLHDFTVLPAVGVRCKIRTKVHPSKKEVISDAIQQYLTSMKVITAKVIQPLPDESRLKGYFITVPDLDEVLQTL